MSRTNKSIVTLYNEGMWLPDRSIPISGLGWIGILQAKGDENEITVTYLCKRQDTIISTGYIYFDYKKTFDPGVDSDIVLEHNPIDGDASLTTWLVEKDTLKLFAYVKSVDCTLEIKIETDNMSGLNEVYSAWGITPRAALGDSETEVILSDSIWRYNHNEDIYNANRTGRVGINTGPSIDSNAMLDVNGGTTLRGMLSFQPPGADIVYVDSDSTYYDFRVWNESQTKARLFIDGSGQVGIDTNAPMNKLHVVGNAQITDCVSIGAGNSPLGKLHVRGVGNTHATTALLLRNSDQKELFRVYDDGTVTIGDPGNGGGPINGALRCEDLVYTNLPKPGISNTWRVTSLYNHPLDGTSDNKFHTVARGAIVEFKGTYKYTINPVNKEVGPEHISGFWGSVDPGPGNASAEKVIRGIKQSSSLIVSFSKDKTGLVIEGDQVVCPEDQKDTTQDIASIVFLDSYYFGFTKSSHPNAHEVGTLIGNDTYIGTRRQTFQGVDPQEKEYTVYAYPVAMGKLEDIILNGASAVLGAFTQQGPMNLKNHAYLSVPCYVYVSNATDAFTNDELEFL